MDTLPAECFNAICLHLELQDIARLAASCRMHASLCGRHNNELWNLLMCQRLWKVDPHRVLDGNIDGWKDQFRKMVKDYESYLMNLKSTNLDGWIERHFLGQLQHPWNGWDLRFWAWSSSTHSFSAFLDESKFHCYGTFPVTKTSTVRRVSPEEQVALSSNYKGDHRNPVTDPRPFVFTLTNTSFPILFACSCEEELQLWLDKISVTLHSAQFEDKAYHAPAKYAMPHSTME